LSSPPRTRPVFVAFSLLSYGVFLATMAYGLGFIGSYWSVLGWKSAWLRSLDAETSSSLGEALAIDALLIALFGVQHSVMARRSFKERSERLIPKPIERSTYVLASSLCLLLLFAEWRPIGLVVWDVSKSAAGIALVLLSLFGWLVVVVSTFLIDHAELFGLRQVFARSPDAGGSPGDFKTPGLYRAVRHPLYFGFLVAFWATPVMTLGHLVFALGVTTYVLIAIPLEERDLLEQFGDRYAEYRKRVRALLPFPR
jgi:protein-S-isoprenylcysteine O-methyltransferase Ste14